VDYFAHVVHKLWSDGGILIHTIHKPMSDKGIYCPQPVDSAFFTPIFVDLTTWIQTSFYFVHIFTTSYPQVMHKLWVNYTRVIPQWFGINSGMSSRREIKG